MSKGGFSLGPNGNFRREPRLYALPDGPIKMAAEFFRKVVRRIETIVPIQDTKQNLIRVIQGGNDGGMIISLNCKTIPLYRVPIAVCQTETGEVAFLNFYTDAVPENLQGTAIRQEVLINEPDIETRTAQG